MIFHNHLKEIFFTGLIFLLLTVSCSKDDDEKIDRIVYPSTSGSHFIKATYCSDVSAGAIKLALENAGYAQFLSYVKCSIRIYTITYSTVFEEDTISVSGLVSYPTDADGSIPTMIVGSGLAYADNEVPSSFSLPDNFSGFEFIASMGYLTLIPDMIGHGVSKGLPSPLHNYTYSAKTMIDLIYAGKDFAVAQDIDLSGKQYLTGYSQGGYVALSALKMIEENSIDDIHIDATVVGAGGYNLVNILNSALEDRYYAAPAHILLLLSSYNQIYHWNRPLTDFFQQPYAGEATELLSGQYNRQQIDAHLTHNLDSLLNPDFIVNMEYNNEPEIMSALAENSVDDWAPISPLNLIHSVGDEVIPFSDSENAYNKMVANGSTSVVLTPVVVTGHVNSGLAFVELAMEWFSLY
jgi:hypothetical protein